MSTAHLPTAPLPSGDVAAPPGSSVGAAVGAPGGGVPATDGGDGEAPDGAAPGRPGGHQPDGDGGWSSPHPRLAAALRSQQVAVDVFDDAVAHSLGINRTDLRCIDILERGQPMGAGALARAARLSTGAMTFVLDRLEAAGFVRRLSDPEDRRRVLVELVPAAHERVRACFVPMVMDARRTLATAFTDGELGVVCRFLQAMTAVYERNVVREAGGGPSPATRAVPPGIG